MTIISFFNKLASLVQPETPVITQHNYNFPYRTNPGCNCAYCLENCDRPKQTFAMVSAPASHASVLLWCNDNGYDGIFMKLGQWWAFPPNAVMAVPIAECTLVDLGSPELW